MGDFESRADARLEDVLFNALRAGRGEDPSIDQPEPAAPGAHDQLVVGPDGSVIQPASRAPATLIVVHGNVRHIAAAPGSSRPPSHLTAHAVPGWAMICIAVSLAAIAVAILAVIGLFACRTLVVKASDARPILGFFLIHPSGAILMLHAPASTALKASYFAFFVPFHPALSLLIPDRSLQVSLHIVGWADPRI